MMAPTELTAAAMKKTGLHLPPDSTTSSAVRGPQMIAGIVACRVNFISILYDQFLELNTYNCV